MENKPSYDSEKRQSAIRRVVGFPEIEENELLEKARDLFEKQKKLPFEREKTERESRIINDILSKLPKFLEEYGVEALKLTPDHIHVLDEGSIPPDQKNTYGSPDKIGGLYIEELQGVVVFSSEDDLKLAERVIHEAIHANSFSSFAHNKKGYHLRRMGLVILGDEEKKRYFHDLNEGLTEELTKRFDKKYSEEMMSLSEAVAKRREFITSIKSKEPEAGHLDDIRSANTTQEVNGNWVTILKKYEYLKERKELLKLTEDIYEKNKDKFNSSKDVLLLFVKAAFTGRLIELGKLVEDSFGKGSFRELGEKTAFKLKTNQNEKQ
jgi:hypothetical protein